MIKFILYIVFVRIKYEIRGFCGGFLRRFLRRVSAEVSAEGFYGVSAEIRPKYLILTKTVVIFFGGKRLEKLG